MIEFDTLSTDRINLGGSNPQLEAELTRMAERTLARWASLSDRKLERILEQTAKRLTEQLTRELFSQLADEPTTQRASGFSSFSPQGLQNPSRLTQSVANQLSNWLVERISPPRTRITQQETDRSRAAESAFRYSRSQQAANTSRTAAKGQRNL